MAVLRDLAGEERADYFRGIQPIWGGGLDDAKFQLFQRRLADSAEAAGRYRLLGWFEGGRMLSAMKAYDLRGSCARRPLKLFGIGAVFTPPALRRNGHAASMLRAAMDEYREKGAQAAVLFSDIDIEYYERLGFRVVESRECSVEAGALPRPSSGFRPAMPGDEPQMTRLFGASRTHETRFALDRDGWTLRFQLRRLRELARARGIGEPEWGIVVDGSAAAMIRYGRDTVDVLEAGWTDDAARTTLLSGLRDCMQRAGRQRLRLWPAGPLRGLFESQPRTSAIAMIAPLDETASLPERNGPTELALLDHI
ncbi:MAG: GNAT family N-acetyltransferase [Myxococcales bacterium]|nr:GNAT family N-acetyltransferase [Myxococcales bacterium]